MVNFRGKSVAITGGAGGIGRALVSTLLARGADVYASDLNEEALAPLAKIANDHPGTLHRFSCDVTDKESLAAFADSIANNAGGIDFWINNAGITQIAPFLDSDPDVFDQVIDINQTAMVAGTRLALRHMEPRGTGTIVNIASVAGHLPAPYMTAYTTSKHAIVGFTRSLQAELEMARSSVNLLLVSPGFADTAIISRGGEHGFPEWLSFMLATPDDVAHAIVHAMDRGKKEVFPTLNGKILRRLYSFLPRTTVKSSRMLFAKSLKDALLNRYEIPEPKPQIKE